MEYTAGNEENELRVRKSWKSQILPVMVIIAMCNLAAALIYWVLSFIRFLETYLMEKIT